MTGILNISEATALALHAMMYLEAHNDRGKFQRRRSPVCLTLTRYTLQN